MPEAPKSRHQIETEAVITQVQQNMRDALDQYIGSVSNEDVRASITSAINAQMQSIAPNSEYRIDVNPDINDPSLMNVDIMIRNPNIINYHVISSVAKKTEVEIEGVVWTKFSLQA